MKELVKKFNDFSLCKVTEKEELLQISQLVLRVIYKHHLNQGFYPKDELQKLYKEDLIALPTSNFYAIYDGYDEIVGAVKSQKWDRKSVLTIEKDFMVNLQYFILGLPYMPKDVFHIGRFAIDQEKIKENETLRQKRITIMKLLMYYALLPIFAGKSNIFFCECDEKLYSKLNLLGLHTHIIGNPKVYLGSKTLPIYCNHSGLKEFINQNKYLSHV